MQQEINHPLYLQTVSAPQSETLKLALRRAHYPPNHHRLSPPLLSMSTATSFARALSPMAGVLAATAAASPDASRLARARAIAAANTVEEVIACLPLQFQADLAAPLRYIASTARKLCTVRNANAKFAALEAKGQVPASIRQKEPTLQMSKEFAETTAGKALVAKALADHKAYVDGLFKQLSAAKTQEFQELSSMLQPMQVSRN
jgi:hypothetical protein